jgi:putative MFS transporter
MPTFFVSQGMTVTKSLAFNAAMMAGWIIGPLLCVLLADRIGRRWGLVAFGLLCAVIGTTYPFLTVSVAIILCGMLMMSTVAIMLVLGLGYVPELFPTEYRFRGSGLAQMVGRAGLIVSPFIVLTLFQGYGINGVIAAIAGMYLIIALLLAFAGVETNRRSLEDLDSEAVMDGQSESMPAVRL